MAYSVTTIFSVIFLIFICWQLFEDEMEFDVSSDQRNGKPIACNLTKLQSGTVSFEVRILGMKHPLHRSFHCPVIVACSLQCDDHCACGWVSKNIRLWNSFSTTVINHQSDFFLNQVIESFGCEIVTRQSRISLKSFLWWPNFLLYSPIGNQPLDWVQGGPKSTLKVLHTCTIMRSISDLDYCRELC